MFEIFYEVKNLKNAPLGQQAETAVGLERGGSARSGCLMGIIVEALRIMNDLHLMLQAHGIETSINLRMRGRLEAESRG